MQCFRIYLKIYKYCTSYYSGQKTYQGHDVKRKKYLVLFNFNFGDFAHFRGNTKKNAAVTIDWNSIISPTGKEMQ